MPFFSCDNFFEYSAYSANVNDNYQNSTEKNLEALQKVTHTNTQFKFAILSDTHYFYDDLRKIVNDINKNDEISFVFITGDFTELGLLKEYDLFYKTISKLNKPYFTVIGNHDYLSNGELIYKQMFGEVNYSFEFNNNKFIAFDNVVWESNKTPDFNWLSKTLENTNTSNNIFLFAHIPIQDNQLSSAMKMEYQEILEEYQVDLCINGHAHNYARRVENNVTYLVVPSVKKESYCIVNVVNNTFSVDLKLL